MKKDYLLWVFKTKDYKYIRHNQVIGKEIFEPNFLIFGIRGFSYAKVELCKFLYLNYDPGRGPSE